MGDHAILTKFAYFQTELDDEESTDLKKALDFAFPKGQYDVTLDEDWKTHPLRQNLPRDTFNKFYKFDFHDLNHTVIAVQGTDSGDLKDILADGRFWIVSAFMDITEAIMMQSILMLPRHRMGIQWLIDRIQASLIIDSAQLDLYAPVVR